MTRRIVGSFLLLGLLTSAGCSWISERRFVASVKNKPAHAFELDTLDGKKVSLQDYRGKAVLLAFWAYG